MKQLIVIFITLWFELSVSKLVAQAQPTDLPNILLILSDDHSYPYLGSYGHPDLQTPNLDRLASEGTLFTKAYTTAPQCVPSRASILSGRSVIDIRMSRFSAPLSAQVKTIPDYLDEKGYYTGICGRHYHLDGSVRMPEETTAAFEKYSLVTFPDRVDYLQIGSDEQVLNQFTEFLEQVPDGSPFFMWMNYSDPHRHFTATDYAPKLAEITVPATMPDTPGLRADLAQHLGEINRLDQRVGEVLEHLAQEGLEDNTLVIFMGDNGAALLRGKGTLYDLGIHVPLIVRWPEQVPKDQVFDQLISGEDILPTILEAAGIKPEQEVTGKSFLPGILGHSYEPNDYIFAQRVPHSSGLPMHTGYFDLSRTVFNQRHKLIYNIVWQLPYSPVDFRNSDFWRDLIQQQEAGKLPQKFSQAFFAEPRSMFELYDLKKDPEEFHNLIEDPVYQEIADSLKARLHEWMIVNQDYVPLPIPPR
jgi:arylsulfatase A-like enzyme